MGQLIKGLGAVYISPSTDFPKDKNVLWVAINNNNSYQLRYYKNNTWVDASFDYVYELAKQMGYDDSLEVFESDLASLVSEQIPTNKIADAAVTLSKLGVDVTAEALNGMPVFNYFGDEPYDCDTEYKTGIYQGNCSNDPGGNALGALVIYKTDGASAESSLYYHQLFFPDSTNAIYHRIVDKSGSDYTYSPWVQLLSPIIDIEYEPLWNRQLNNQLVLGQQYRIIDYNTTTVQSGTLSAGHQFDIIVTADDDHTLNENARAILHSGDPYFSEVGADLNSWELKYCIDNDTTRFDWADEVNGKGVIYYMKDEWGNECPYDFKNIMFTRYKLGEATIEDESSASDWCIAKKNMLNAYLTESNSTPSYVWTGTSTDYYFWEEAEGIVYSSYLGETKEFYTFSNFISNEVSDKSLTNKCNNNVIKGHNISNNIFIYTSIDNGCFSNTFGDNCFSNTFGDNCYSNTFGDNCFSNTFGDNCYSNTFGTECNSNTFGTGFGYNTFGDNCYYNTFGTDCDDNTFGTYCSSNTLGAYCDSNTFGNNCLSNTFGTYCSSNTFGTYCRYNIFGTSGSPKSYCRYFIIENGNSYLRINPRITTAYNLYAQNIIVKQGVNNTNTYVQVNIPATVVNQSYQWTIAKDSSGNIRQYCLEDEVTLIGTTYSDLVRLRTNNKLVPGRQYRITDYNTTTVQENTSYANHPFDIIVTADNSSTLNENARAILNSGDNYFSSNHADLSAWELKYCIDNDTTRFTWADSSANGKGVIYYMKDEWGNECPYDFKNILFTRTIGGPITVAGDYYTFNAINIDDNSFHDATLLNYLQLSDGGTQCYGNIIKELYNEDDDNSLHQILNSNIFSNEYSLDEESYFKCYSNTFGNNCDSNTFGTYCRSNTFGNSCNSHTFGIGCHSNTFGNYCSSNTFSDYCNHNTFSNYCFSNTFSNYCNHNTFGIGCYSNTFGMNCSSNTFGNDCNSNTFGNDCNYNTFSNYCNHNTFGNYCSSNTFGNYCSSNTFGLSSSYKSYCRYFIIESGNRNLMINPLATTSSASYAQNIIIKQGVTDSNSYVTIDIPANVVNQNYQWTIAKDSSGNIRQYCLEDKLTF